MTLRLSLSTDELFTIKHDGTTSHIAGITLRSGREVCSAVATVKSLETGPSFDQIADALAHMDAIHKIPCRVCHTAATLINNRAKEN